MMPALTQRRRRLAWLAGSLLLVAPMRHAAAIDPGAARAEGEAIAARTLDSLVPEAAQRWQRDAADFAGSMAQLCAPTPPARPAALTVARDAWVRAMTRWRRVAVLPLRPLFAGQLAYDVDWPSVNPVLLAKAIDTRAAGATDDAVASQTLIGRLSVEIRGMGTLSVLLWPHADDPASMPALTSPPTCRYALRLAEFVAARAAALVEATHQPLHAAAVHAGAPPPSARAAATATEVLLAALVDGLRQVQKRTLAAASVEATLHSPSRLVLVDGARAAQTAMLFRASGDQLAAAALDPGPAGSADRGLVVLLRRTGHSELVAPWMQAFSNLQRDVRGLPAVVQPADPRHRRALEQVGRDARQLIALLTGRIAVALDVVIGVGDGDGG